MYFSTTPENVTILPCENADLFHLITYIAFSKMDGFENSRLLRCMATTEFQLRNIRETVKSDLLLH